MSIYEQEIKALHELFVDWYCGTAEDDRIDRLSAALAPEFEMITPDGDTVPRDTVIDAVSGTYDEYEPGEFEIEIRNVEQRAAMAEHALVRYEEWQTTPDGETGRISTVLFREDPAAPLGVVWVDLQETWLEG